jgi:Cdc6-like AAA superfamily ATPase
MNVLTQEDIFRDAESGGFTVGYKLPNEEGNLDNFKVIRIQAKKGDAPTRLVNRIIEAFGCKPLRGLLQRGKQLTQLIGSYTDQGVGLIVVIEAAHLLNRHTIYSLKLIREHTTKPFPPAHAGFVLLSNPETIQATVNADQSVMQRANRLPTLLKLVGS